MTTPNEIAERVRVAMERELHDAFDGSMLEQDITVERDKLDPTRLNYTVQVRAPVYVCEWIEHDPPVGCRR